MRLKNITTEIFLNWKFQENGKKAISFTVFHVRSNLSLSLSSKKFPGKWKKKFPIDTNNGETPYSNDRPVPQLSIQGKYVHPAI